MGKSDDSFDGFKTKVKRAQESLSASRAVSPTPKPSERLETRLKYASEAIQRDTSPPVCSAGVENPSYAVSEYRAVTHTEDAAYKGKYIPKKKQAGYMTIAQRQAHDEAVFDAMYPKAEPVKRKCLNFNNCGKWIMSDGAHHRRCVRCREMEACPMETFGSGMWIESGH